MSLAVGCRGFSLKKGRGPAIHELFTQVLTTGDLINILPYGK